jgi:hypothetical protein
MEYEEKYFWNLLTSQEMYIMRFTRQGTNAPALEHRVLGCDAERKTFSPGRHSSYARIMTGRPALQKKQRTKERKEGQGDGCRRRAFQQ